MQNITLKSQNNYSAFARYYCNAALARLQGFGGHLKF
jgi:hypothetical protein